MSLQVSLVPELREGACDRCCGGPTTTQRFYIEVGDNRCETPWLCRDCHMTPTRTELQEPPQERGPKPPSRQRRKAVDRQERETATLIGGYKQKASGAMSSAKGDVRLKGALRGEMKSTEKASFVLKRAVLDKIRGECVGAERPFVTVRFISPLTLATEDEWVVIPIEDWEHNRHAASKHQRPAGT